MKHDDYNQISGHAKIAADKARNAALKHAEVQSVLQIIDEEAAQGLAYVDVEVASEHEDVVQSAMRLLGYGCKTVQHANEGDTVVLQVTWA